MTEFHPVPKPQRNDRKRAKDRGTYAERKVAEKLGGRRVYKSGASIFEKGDVRVDDLKLFVEVKYTGVRQGQGEDSVTVRREWVEKTILDAQAAGCLPVVALRFRNGDGLYCARGEDFEELVRQLRYYRELSER